MEHVLLHKILNIPAFVWGLQLLYVATVLGLFVILGSSQHRYVAHLHGQVVYALIMIAVNIVWRVTLKKLKPEWF